MAADFDKQLKGIFNTVRSTINPDYAIPKDKVDEPMNVRIKRMKDASETLAMKLKELNEALSAFTTNLNALTEEIQPYLASESSSESNVKAEAGVDTAKGKPKAGAEPKAKDNASDTHDATSEEVVTELKPDDSGSEDKPADK